MSVVYINTDIRVVPCNILLAWFINSSLTLLYYSTASFAKANKKFHTWACLLCLIYFIYDLSWSVIFQTEGLKIYFNEISIVGSTQYINYITII